MEWKGLKIDDLPPDILTEGYEFKYSILKLTDRKIYLNMQDPLVILQLVWNEEIEASYRKPEPKQPTHEEIMTKWWFHADGVWRKVFAYNQHGYEGEGAYSFILNGNSSAFKPGWFTYKESADIPPE